MIVHEADQGQIGKSPRRVIGIEVPLPLLETVVVRKRGIETAKVRIGKGRQGDIRRWGHDGVGGERVVRQRSLAGGFVIAGRVYEKTIVANRQTRAQRVVPQVACIDFIVRSIRCGGVGLAR